mgnify:CR=1 FL=1
MLRSITLINTNTGEAVLLPVTPTQFEFESGRNVETLDMAQTGEVNLPGLEKLFDQQMEFLLPAEGRSYADAGWIGDPYTVVEKMVGWSLAKTVLRLIIPGTSVTYPVLLGPVIYGEYDGTNDVTVKLTFRRYRYLGVETTEKTSTGNTGRVTATSAKATTVHIVVSGETLWSICRKYYGDGALYPKLAKFNSIKNANLIRVGQRVIIPDKSKL